MGYDFSAGEAVGLGLGVFLIVLYAVAFVMIIAQYVLNGIALLRMAKKLGIPNGWMGFVPFTDVYLLGKIADTGAEKKVNAKRLLITYILFFVMLVLYMAVAVALGLVSAAEPDMTPAMLVVFILFLLVYIASAILLSVFMYIAYYRICENFGGTNATGWFLGILLGSLFCSSTVIPILLLILSFKTPAKTENPSAYVTPPAPPSDSVFQ